MNYSKQLNKNIDSKAFASTTAKPQDDRAVVSYFIDENNLIHSNSFNYSIVQASPMSVVEFKEQLHNYHSFKIN